MPFSTELWAARAQDRERLLTEGVLALVVAFLGFDEDEELDGDEPFLELGFDSLRAVDFKILLEEQLDCELSATLLFDCATPRQLAQYLEQVLFGQADPKVSVHEVRPAEPLAIVGLACRYPGGAEGPEGFWDLCVSGRDAISEVPPDRWDCDAYFDPDPAAPGRMSTRWGGFLENIGDFDAAFFGISPREARALDPAQRILVESVWHALEDAALPPSTLRGSATGVFVGTRGADYYQGQTSWAPEDATRYYATGNAASTLAGRVSYLLGLNGPCFALDTACSSSLVALHQAALSLEARECSAAIVAGVNVVLDPFGTIAISKAEMLSPDGRCKAFSAAADGYVRSEGCGVVVLKRLADAEAAGDRIWAVVRGSAINQDGASAGLTVPSSAAQEAVIRQALGRAGLEPDQVDYVEAHGTGTSLGDPIEFAALDAVFGTQTREGRLAVGTIKTQLGHSEPAAGIAGLIRTVLSLQHEALTPNLHFDEPNPYIPWDKTVVEVVDRPRAWPRTPGRARLAGINSFGFSGTNAHVVVEEAPLAPEATPADDAPTWLPLSAKSPVALTELARDLARVIESGRGSLAELSAALIGGRDHHAFRASVVAASHREATELLARLAPAERCPKTPPRIAFLFTGQGSQFAGMGAELYTQSRAFREAFDAAAHACAPLDLKAEIFGEATRLNETEITQPALFAIEYALAKLWASFGIEPAWVLGHSVGELAAAVVAGMLSLEDAGKLAVARGQLMAEGTPPGAMLAVLAAPEVVEPLCADLSDELAIAALNCDARLSVSGPTRAIDQLAVRLDELGERYERLAVTRAFHSPLMDPVLPRLAALAASLTNKPARLGFMSTLEAAPLTHTSPDYWTRHAREPVRFQEAMRALDAEGIDAYIEIGPAPHLLGLARRFLDRKGPSFLPSMRPGRDPHREFFSSLAALYALGARVTGPRAHAALPRYPFQRQRFWLERSTPDKDRTQGPAAGLLGEPVDSSRVPEGAALFAAHLAQSASDPLRDHRVLGKPIFPAAAYVALLAEAALRAQGTTHATLTGLKITAPLPLADGGLKLETEVQPVTGERRPLAVLAKTPAGDWKSFASAHAVAASAPSSTTCPLAELEARCTEAFTPDELYARVAALGLEYGLAYRTVTSVQSAGDECLARVAATSPTGATPPPIDPAVLDGCFQATTYVVPDELRETPFLPLGLDRLELFGPIAGALICHARRTQASGRVVVIDLDLWSESGAPVAHIEGLRLLATDRATLLAIGDPLEGLAFVRTWQPSPLARSQGEPRARQAVLVAGPAPRSQALTRALAEDLIARGWQLEVREAPAKGAELLRTTTDVIDLSWIGAPELLDTEWAAQATAALALTTEARPRIWLVTSGATLEASCPTSAAALGLARALELEDPRAELTTLDLDPLREEASDLADELALAGPEREVAWRGGVRYVARLVPGVRDPEHRLEPPESGDWRLAVRRLGSLDQLDLVPTEVREPGPDEVCIEVEAAALNFKDVLFAMGMLQEHTGITRGLEQPLGHECAGRIVALGASVEAAGRLRRGQAVFVAHAGAMQSRITVPAATVCAKPRGLSMAEAAGLPTVFLTAIYGLERVARIGPGDSILIHAAAGGVGQAAIEIARRAGAKILATASRGKWPFLKSLGIEHVFDSRSLDYTDEVLRATGGRGVDIVLDSMAGEHVAGSLDCLAEGGRFVELGKLGVWSAAEVAAKRPDVDYALFDLAEVFADDPALHVELFRELEARFGRGELAPIPTRTFELGAAEAAFRELAAARNIGKLCLLFPSRRDRSITSEKSYLVTGGLGALGLHVASWLAEEGAGEVLLIGRSGASDEAEAKLRRIRRQAPNTRLVLAAADVTDRAALGAALDGLSLPLSGVFHAAGRLDDGLAIHLDAERNAGVLAPKWQGALHLHELTGDLDHFVLFSSMTAMVGAAGQTNYAAANAGLDAFAAWRRGRGLAGLSIAWGPWSGGGMATRQAEAEHLDAAGIASLSPEVATRALAALVALPTAAPALGLLAVDWARYLARRAPLPLFEELTKSRPANAAEAHQAAALDLAGLTKDERKELLTERIRAELAGVLGFASPDAIDTALPFSDLGIDSLIAVDLRNRLEAALGVELAVTLLFDHDHLDSLIDHLAEAAHPATQGALDDEAALAAEVAALSDEEVERLLAEEESLG